MRRAFADFSPAAPAAFAAGLGVALWIFLLPAGVVQRGPTPVLPASGEAGRVVADLPVAGRRASVARKGVATHPHVVVALRPPATKPRQVHRATPVVRRAPSAPVRVTAPAAPRTPVTKAQLFSMPPTAKGKARGHGRGPGPELPPGLAKKASQLPPGLAKKAAPASEPGAPARPKGNGGGNGRNDNGDENDGKGQGRGNGHKGEKE